MNGKKAKRLRREAANKSTKLAGEYLRNYVAPNPQPDKEGFLKGFWQGETAYFRPCLVKLILDEEHPFYWQNAFAGLDIQALEVTYEDQTWLIANHDGTGYYKLTKGMGSPRCGHASFGKHEFLRYISPDEMITEVNMELIKRNEDIVDAYQKAKDPVEFERMQRLKETIRSFQKMSPMEQVKHINENMMPKAEKGCPFDEDLSGK